MKDSSRFTIHNLQEVYGSQLSNEQIYVCKLRIENLLKTVNCKLKIQGGNL